MQAAIAAPGAISRAARRAGLVTLLACLHGCSLMFPTGAGEELAHFPEAAPAVGEVAPPVALFMLDGEATTLEALSRERPVVVQLGSHSCPVFRYRRFDMDELKAKYSGRVDFVVIYTQEAHPAGSASPYRDGEEWLTVVNRFTGVRLGQPETLEERIARARWSADVLKTGQDGTRVLVDGMDNAAWALFGRAPSPAFVLDTNGAIVLRQPWVEPLELDATLAAMTGIAAEPPEATVAERP